MAVSGNQTFAIYLYADGLIQWSQEGKALAGYSAGDGQTYYNISGSLSTELLKISSTSNVGYPGLWVFRVDNNDLVFLSCVNQWPGIQYQCNSSVHILFIQCASLPCYVFAEAEVRFENQVYTFHENDDEVEVCLTTFEDITYNFTVCLDISVQALDTQPATGV